MDEDTTNWYFGTFANRIQMHPETFDFDTRMEALAAATAESAGVVMLVWSSWTEYFKDATVPVGKIKVYEAKQYGATPTYSGVLDGDEDYEPFMFEEDR